MANSSAASKNGGSSRVHPAVPDLQSDLRQGKMTRREFVRMSTALGVSGASAVVLAACGQQLPGAPDGRAAGSSLAPAQGTAAIQRGGTFRISMLLQSFDHPARLAWVPGVNIVRQVAEYLTETGIDNITRPHLLERWEASGDLKTWTLFLRQGITFNTGDPLTADDVIFNFEQWLDPDIGSSMLGLLSYLGGAQNVEKVDDHTVRLHLQSANIGVPEHLFHDVAAILPRTFEGDFIQQPVGTGAFDLTEYAEGERAVFKRREGYWRLGQDGRSLPYLDELIYISQDNDAGVAAMEAGQVDSITTAVPQVWLALRDNPDLAVNTSSTAGCFLVRMRADVPPWDDVRVRKALKLCQDRQKILQLAYFGEGELSFDAHVAPIHPAYAERPIPAYDPQQARALLEEAGYGDGLQVTLVSKNNQAEPDIAQALKEMAAPAGFDITLNLTEPNQYWERWTTVDLGITGWGHRPLETMVLRLAYTADAEGVPTAFNETHWIDEEFTALLTEAEGTLDVAQRRETIGRLEDIMQERGPIGNSFWAKIWEIMRSEFQNVQAGPDAYHRYYEVWKSDR